MANLSDLPYDILTLIAKQLKKLEDFTCFKSVSKSLRAAVKDEHFEGLRLRQGTPYLLLPVRDNGNDDTREFYSLVNGESIVASVKIPKFKRRKCLESLGWLLASEENGNMSLVDPFSGTEIPLPHQNTFPDYDSVGMDEYVFMQKMVLSSRPSENPDFILMVIGGGGGYLAFWRLGDKAWNKMCGRKGQYTDIVYGGGEQFYAVGHPGILWVFNLAENDNDHVVGRIIIHFKPIVRVTYPPPSSGYPSYNLYTIKTVDERLLIITRTAPKMDKDGLSYITNKFHVFEVDIATSTMKEIYSLGNMAVFVGHNSTIALNASRFPREVIKANHIYFTHDDFEFYYVQGAKGGGMDIGIYNLETGIVEPIYPGEPLMSKISTSTWITPCF